MKIAGIGKRESDGVTGKLEYPMTGASKWPGKSIDGCREKAKNMRGVEIAREKASMDAYIEGKTGTQRGMRRSAKTKASMDAFLHGKLGAEEAAQREDK